MSSKFSICVAGWYNARDLYLMLSSLPYRVTIVSHNPEIGPIGMETIHIPNVGLEFGCYDYYLKNIWNGGNVLFMHDDIYIHDNSVFNDISLLSHDCAYIFRDIGEEKANGGKHGRAIYCSEKFLDFIKHYTCICRWMEFQAEGDARHDNGPLPCLPPHSGFWYDPFNKGHISGKPPKGVRHYNEAIYHFHWQLGRIRDQRCGSEKNWPHPKEKMDVVNRVYLKYFVAGRRAGFYHVVKEKEKYGVN